MFRGDEGDSKRYSESGVALPLRVVWEVYCEYKVVFEVDVDVVGVVFVGVVFVGVDFFQGSDRNVVFLL